MPSHNGDLSETIIHLVAVAGRLEGEGQYNLAKLARAAAESLVRKEAFGFEMPTEKEQLVAEIERTADSLSLLGLGDEITDAFRRGAAIMAEGRLPMIKDTPHPYICRTCGHLELDTPVEKCPICNVWPVTFLKFPPVYWLDA
jgi:rubrerythrin